MERQELAGNKEYFLVLVGSFLHAYGHGAFALARATGYRVMRKQRKWGEVLTVGFPAGRLDLVRQRLRDAGGYVEQVDDKTWMFRDVDGTPDRHMVCDPAPAPSQRVEGSGCAAAPASSPEWLAEAVCSFNLSMSTPMDAMLFIGTLQQRLKEQDYMKNACESPAGHGLQE